MLCLALLFSAPAEGGEDGAREDEGRVRLRGRAGQASCDWMQG